MKATIKLEMQVFHELVGTYFASHFQSTGKVTNWDFIIRYADGPGEFRCFEQGHWHDEPHHVEIEIDAYEGAFVREGITTARIDPDEITDIEHLKNIFA